MSFAIIDAATGTEARACGCEGRSHYSTSIANLPLIYHVFDELAAAGSSRVRVVVSPDARDELEQVLDGGSPWGVEVSFTTAAEPDGRATVLAAVEQIAPEEPVLVCPGDCLFPGGLSTMWERFRAGDVDAVVSGGGNGGGRRGRTVEAEAAPRVCSAPAIVGPRGVPLIQGLRSTTANHRDLATWLRISDGRIAVCELGQWCYSDDTEDLLTANRMMLDSLPVPAVDGGFGDNNVVRGRVAISSSAYLSGSVLHGPVAVDDGAVIEDSFVGPYCAIGAGAVLRGAEIDNTMVLAGAAISHPGQRIEASIIGEQAAVVRSFTLPKGLHMRLEPHSRVILS
ncbi:MAG TPA: sugar phosphate nucleotidyltransferase [Solirubrobacteraceae bacterium]|nr:sugar phosphate nucleotidyltransferase [Solirubrobacteraceae bacterium]